MRRKEKRNGDEEKKNKNDKKRTKKKTKNCYRIIRIKRKKRRRRLILSYFICCLFQSHVWEPPDFGTIHAEQYDRIHEEPSQFSKANKNGLPIALSWYLFVPFGRRSELVQWESERERLRQRDVHSEQEKWWGGRKKRGAQRLNCTWEGSCGDRGMFAHQRLITPGFSQDRMRYEISDSWTKLKLSYTPSCWNTLSLFRH